MLVKFVNNFVIASSKLNYKLYFDLHRSKELMVKETAYLKLEILGDTVNGRKFILMGNAFLQTFYLKNILVKTCLTNLNV